MSEPEAPNYVFIENRQTKELISSQKTSYKYNKDFSHLQ